MKPARSSSRYLLLALIIALAAHGCLLLWRGMMAHHIAPAGQITVSLLQTPAHAAQSAMTHSQNRESPALEPLAAPAAAAGRTDPKRATNPAQSIKNTKPADQPHPRSPDEVQRESGVIAQNQSITQTKTQTKTAVPETATATAPPSQSAAIARTPPIISPGPGSIRCGNEPDANCPPALPGPAGSPGVQAATNGTTQAIRILQAPKPVMPESSRERGEEGTVSLRIHVNTQGVADEVRVQQSSGSPRLDEAARSTVQQHWRFAPAERNGNKIAADTIQLIEFRLND